MTVASTMPCAGYRVDDLVIDVGQRRIWRGETELPLPQLSLDFLLALVRAAPNLVTTDSLVESVWPGLAVSPETITQRVKLVREALGDDPHAPRYIGTIRGRGYRLLVPAESFDSSKAAHATEQPMTIAAAAGSHRWRAWVVAGAVLALGAVLAVQFQARRTTGDASPPSTATGHDSIAVLPFANLGGDPENEYFGDGLGEELANRLSLMTNLHVAARTSTLHFKNTADDVRSIGRKLGVRHLLRGGVQKQGDRVRVTAYLLSTEDGRTIWSRDYDGREAEVFAIQEEIARAVAAQFNLPRSNSGVAAPNYRMTSSPDAFDLYLRGRHLYQGWKLERIDKGIEYFKAAIRIDPGFAAAYVLQAEALLARAQNTGECCNPEGEWFGPRRELLRRAIELDAGNADAIASNGLDLMLERDFEGAARELHRAEAINPNGELVLRYLNWYYHAVGWPPERAIGYARHLFRLDPLNSLAALGVAQAYWQSHEYEQSLAAADEAIELDPSSWMAHWVRNGALIDLGRYAEAITSAERTLATSEGVTDAYADLIVAYAGAGRIDEARELFARIDSPDFKPRWRHGFRACALAGLGDYDDAVTALEHAFRENDGFLHEVLHYKLFMPMHGDPRFQAMVRSLGLERRIQHTRDKNEARQLSARSE